MLLTWNEVNIAEIRKQNPVVDRFFSLGTVRERIPSSSHNCPKTMGAYLLVHVKSGKCYVGSNLNLYSRKYQHLHILRDGHHNSFAFQEAYNSDVRLLPLYLPTEDREEAYRIEQLILDEFYSTGLLLNSATNARHAGTGFVVTPETRLKISMAGKGKKQTPEWIKKRTEKSIGRKLSDELKQRLREKAIARGINPNMTVLAALAMSKKVIVDGVIYPSVKAAGLKYGIVGNSASKRIRSKSFPNWYYASDIFDRKISVNGLIYDSIDTYGKLHDRSVQLIKYRVDSAEEQYKDWFYLPSQNNTTPVP
jgi:group I intron endonuclease